MKKLLVILLVCSLTLMMAGCGSEDTSGEETFGNGEYVLGENAFGVHVTVKNMTTDTVKFMVIPHADEFGYEGQGEIGEGIFGTDGLIPGKKKGDNAELDGSFKIYAFDENGPSATITVKGTYSIDALSNDFSTMHFYLFDGTQFIESNQETVNK